VGNDLVCLEAGARDDAGRHWLDATTETYQWFVMTVCLAMLAAVNRLKASKRIKVKRIERDLDQSSPKMYG
jgi:hypothetical protein